MTTLRPRIVGAYAASPAEDRRAFLDDVLALPGVDGLEISWGSPSWHLDRSPTTDALDAAEQRSGRRCSTVVTLVGSEATAAAASGAGIASIDEDRRRAAVATLRASRDEIVAWTAQGRRLLAVEIHAFPSVEPEKAQQAGDALRRSLGEIASWDWAGAHLLVEHCDARVSQSWSKGLLPLDVELAAVAAVAETAPPTPVGIALNTGRSAIEGRDVATVLEHVARSAQAGLLRGIVVSGATHQTGPYGAPWSDVHPPLRDQCEESVVTADRVRAALVAAGETLLFDGVKVAAATHGASVSDRLALVRTTLDALPG
jgi:hypothetical protein